MATAAGGKDSTEAKKGRAARKASPYNVPTKEARGSRRSDRVQEIEAKPKQKAFPFPGQVLLAQKYDEDSVDPKGWWMSEKLDGVRAYWSGKKVYTRNGNVLVPPDWFVKDFPEDMSLDGELFGGRGMFQTTISIVKTQKDERWKNIRYKIFDVPSHGKLPFEKRMEMLKERFEDGKTDYLSLVEHTLCKGKEHIDEELPKMLARGGEGLMIREPKSQYEHRRSYTLLKIKKFYDAEAIVIGYEKSKSGAGGVGALRCRMECGKEMKVGSGLTNKDRRNPPKIGTIITYKFQEYSDSGSPRFPSYIGIRIDMDAPKDADVPAKIKEAVT